MLMIMMAAMMAATVMVATVVLPEEGQAQAQVQMQHRLVLVLDCMAQVVPHLSWDLPWLQTHRCP